MELTDPSANMAGLQRPWLTSLGNEVMLDGLLACYRMNPGVLSFKRVTAQTRHQSDLTAGEHL